MHFTRVAGIAIAWVLITIAGRGRPAAVAGAEQPVAEPAARTGGAEKPVAAGRQPGVSAATDPTRAERVRTFVREYQPELADLLDRLQDRKPDEYAAALADLDKTVLALAASKAKDERLHAIELRVWQARTRIDLLVARWMTGSKKNRAKLEPQLREALAAEIDARAEHLAYRKQRSAAWYDRQIARLRDTRDDLVAERLDDLLAEPGRKRKPAGR